MKKLILIAMVIGFTGFVNAQDDVLPAKVKAAFDAKYPGVAEPYFSEIDGKYIIEFEYNEGDLSAVFTSAGVFVESKEYVSDTQVSAAAMKAATTKYPNGEFYDLYKITLADGSVAFEMSTDTETSNYVIRVSDAGKILSTVATSLEGDY